MRDLLSLPGLADYWMPLFAMAWTADSRHLIYAPTRRSDKRVELKRYPSTAAHLKIWGSRWRRLGRTA